MRKRLSLTRILLLLAVLLLCPVLKSSLAQAPESNSPTASNTPSAQIDALVRGVGKTRSISQVAISPDGKRLAWTEMRQLFVAPVDDLKKPLRITAATSPATSPGQRCGDSDPVWSPDSSSLAFFSDCGNADGQNDLYLRRLDANAPLPITQLHGFVHEAAFSPDGTKIAFLYVEGATRPAGALAAMKPPSGVIGEDGIEVQRIAPTPPSRYSPILFRPPISTPMSSPGRPIQYTLPTSQPSRPVKTTGGRRSFTTRRILATHPTSFSIPSLPPDLSTACKSPCQGGRLTASQSHLSAA
jgi:hypothetical protein